MLRGGSVVRRGEKTDYRALIAIWIYAGALFVGAYFLQHVTHGLWIFGGMALSGLVILVLWYSKKAVYRCTSCGEEFQISPIIHLISRERVNRKHLKCPHCGHTDWHPEQLR